MALHGASSSFTLQRLLADPTVARMAARAAGPGSDKGFRHFIADPAAGQQFTIDGTPYDPANEIRRARAIELMRRLALRLEREPAPAKPADLDNRAIPAGYTYFAQLVAHDLVQSSASLSLAGGRLAAVSNSRLAPLRLETVYDDGPTARLDLYAPRMKKDAPPAAASSFYPLLRVGPLRESGTIGPGNPAPKPTKHLFDLERAGCPFSNTTRSRGLPEAIIGDPRNDDHPLLSQLVVLFHHVHNSIFNELATRSERLAQRSDFEKDYLGFLGAQAATTLIYRNLVRCDLLRRLLDPRVRAAYEDGTVTCIDQAVAPGERWQVPYEVSHGVLRALHTMVRPGYEFNTVGHPEIFSLGGMLRQSSEKSPMQMPLEVQWAVDWKRFFGPGATNHSRRIRPLYDFHLSNQTNFPSETQAPVDGLAFRDLLSGIDGMPWSVGALVDQLAGSHGALIGLSPLLKPDPSAPGTRRWSAPLKAWLESVPAWRPSDDFTADDVASLSVDPPLGLFFIFEAAFGSPTGGGDHLGVLGSILTADVFYNVLRNDALVDNEFRLSLQYRMAEVSRLVYPGEGNFLSFIPEITTFEELLDFMTTRMPQVF